MKPTGRLFPALVPSLAILFSGCATAPLSTPAPAAAVASDVKAAAAQALEAYADYKAGNVNLLWSLSKGATAYQTLVKDASDIKALVQAWTGNTGDSQKLAARLARIFGTTPPANAAAAIAEISTAVAANSGP
jgi:flagellar motility protein MotE (MotC chaperone)